MVELTDNHVRMAMQMGFSTYAVDLPQPVEGQTLAEYGLVLEGIQREKQAAQLDKLMKLPTVKSQRISTQPLFKLPFETLEQIKLRLAGSLIFVGEELMYVRDVYPAENNFLLKLEDYRGKTYRAWYSDENIDLRSPEPQYILYRSRPAYMTRRARRQQQQGLSRNNTGVKYVGEDDFISMDSIHDVMASMKKRSALRWDAKLEELMLEARAIPSLKLTDKVAVWVHRDRLVTEYKGRPFGPVYEDNVYCHSDDCSRQWIKNDFKAAGFMLKEQAGG